uniref:Uncharacterized protein n=2 Tax=Rhizophora mucronata TaxID=61149 RepID=A0A2P2L630_RHIMU
MILFNRFCNKERGLLHFRLHGILLIKAGATAVTNWAPTCSGLEWVKYAPYKYVEYTFPMGQKHFGEMKGAPFIHPTKSVLMKYQSLY